MRKLTIAKALLQAERNSARTMRLVALATANRRPAYVRVNMKEVKA